jgi:hypothetical protein
MLARIISRLFCVLVMVIGLCACAAKSPSTGLNLPSKSPARVVRDYLEALKKYDFDRSYDFISIGYAGNLDRESYKINMKHNLIDNFNWKLINYEVIGVRIIGDQAFVVTELEVKYRPRGSKEDEQRRVRVQYVLTVLDKSWKITSDECVFNCITQDELNRG